MNSNGRHDDEAVVLSDERVEELLSLEQALERLEATDPGLRRVVECRYFAASTIEETAEALGISPATARRDCQTARAWLRRAPSERGKA